MKIYQTFIFNIDKTYLLYKMFLNHSIFNHPIICRYSSYNGKYFSITTFLVFDCTIIFDIDK